MPVDSWPVDMKGAFQEQPIQDWATLYPQTIDATYPRLSIELTAAFPGLLDVGFVPDTFFEGSDKSFLQFPSMDLSNVPWINAYDSNLVPYSDTRQTDAMEAQSQDLIAPNCNPRIAWNGICSNSEDSCRFETPPFPVLTRYTDRECMAFTPIMDSGYSTTRTNGAETFICNPSGFQDQELYMDPRKVFATPEAPIDVQHGLLASTPSLLNLNQSKMMNSAGIYLDIDLEASSMDPLLDLLVAENELPLLKDTRTAGGYL